MQSTPMGLEPKEVDRKKLQEESSHFSHSAIKSLKKVSAAKSATLGVEPRL